MPQVKVRRRGITAEDTAAVIRSGLDGQVQVTPDGDNKLDVEKNFFVRAKVSIRDDPGGTAFDVRGAGAGLLLWIVMRVVNDRGIAQQVADAIGSHDGFSDDA